MRTASTCAAATPTGDPQGIHIPGSSWAWYPLAQTTPPNGAAVTEAMKPVELTVVDTNTATWELFPVAYIGATLEHVPLMSDPDTGMMILKMVYRAGFTNPWHSHPCAHGVYVLEGTLNTHQGRYPAGSFVWFPEGGIMEHGATQEEDCTFLFITNKPFDIHFVGDENDPAAPKV
jgi:anti-sigma factor ChrR (cupin superfamily)